MCNSRHKWEFATRFRRGAFGWRSQPAITRVKQALAEISRIARRDPILAAEGAVLFLEKLSPALSQVDSSSGAMGTAVNHAIGALIPVIAGAPAEPGQRDKWLERLWTAIEDDGIPYLETLADSWGDLCAIPQCASKWADGLIDTVRRVGRPEPDRFAYFKGTTACLSALLKAGRYAEVLDLLELPRFKSWHYRQFGAQALLAAGKADEALRYAEDTQGPNENYTAIARTCEQILLSAGRVEEAYRQYAQEANQQATYLGTFRAIVAKYPSKNASDILRDLVEGSPGSEGKWFAAAKSAGLHQEAINLANRTPCDPRTLIRAARDWEKEEPLFAVEAGMAALKWLAQGYGYEITGADILSAYHHTVSAAQAAGCKEAVLTRIDQLVAADTLRHGFVSKILGRRSVHN